MSFYYKIRETYKRVVTSVSYILLNLDFHIPYKMLIDIIFLHIQFTRFQLESLQSLGTFKSRRRWDPIQKTMTK